ncbi:hypothetical protein ACFYON_26875 [Micromonospora sp. NPDC005686]|uniref:hypothetical protein n=1 Tax=unclassified Micromonospora TaxID=2617518 RepID=UPI0033A25660
MTFESRGLGAPPTSGRGPINVRFVIVKRADGTRVSVQTTSFTDRYLLTAEEMAAVALDPKIRLG